LIKWYIILSLFLLFFQKANCQTIEREVVSANGAEITIDSLNINWTLGEVLVNSYFTESFNLVEGYQQPISDSISFILEGYDNEVLIYPNPFSVNLTIELKTPVNKDIQLLFVNSLGQSVKREYLPRSNSKIEIDVSELFPGYYSLLFKDGTTIISVSKLLKTK